MDEFIKLLDKNLEYISHEIIEEIIYINVASNKKECICPYCGSLSSKMHSTYARSFQDLPMQDKKVTIILNNRKLFCNNKQCTHKTFAEKFDFIAFKGKKTKRLETTIINIAMNVSSLTATSLLRNSIANVGKSTICNLLKKNTIYQ